MGTIITKPGGGGGTSSAFKGFKYNVSNNLSGVAPSTAPGQAIFWYTYYNDGESSGYTLSGLSIDIFDADSNYMSSFIGAMNGQPCAITDSSGNYKGYISNGLPVYVSTGSYYSILSPTVNLPYDTSGDSLVAPGVYYFNFGTSNIASQPVLVSGSNIKTINGGSILGSGNLITPKGNHAIYGTPGFSYTNTVNASNTIGGLAVANQTGTFTPFTPVKTFTASSFSIQITATTGIQSGGWLGIYTAIADGQIGGTITIAQQYTAQLNLITNGPGIYTVSSDPFVFLAGVTYWIGWACYLLATGSATVASYDTRAMLPITNEPGVAPNIGYRVTGLNGAYGPSTINLNTATLTTNCAQVWFNIGSTP